VLVRLIGYQAKAVSGVQVTVAPSRRWMSPYAQTVTLEELTVSARRSAARSPAPQTTAAVGQRVNAVTAEEISGARTATPAAVQGQRRDGAGRPLRLRARPGRAVHDRFPQRRAHPEPGAREEGGSARPLSPGLLEDHAKTFTPTCPATSGAEVNIRTKEFPARRQATFSISTGFNTRATGKDLYRARNAGLEWLALGSSDRELLPWSTRRD
jgi:hypothetical protein